MVPMLCASDKGGSGADCLTAYKIAAAPLIYAASGAAHAQVLRPQHLKPCLRRFLLQRSPAAAPLPPVVASALEGLLHMLPCPDSSLQAAPGTRSDR